MKIQDDQENSVQQWQAWAAQWPMSETQLTQFKDYAQLLLQYNEVMDLTAHDTLGQILTSHFTDSLSIMGHVDFTTIKALADIGTGAGFPALPLKIMYPHVRMYLIEVNYKRRTFLAEVIEKLGLADIEIINLDWRNFVRKTNFPIDLFITRATIDPFEIIRMFKPSSPYKNATAIYWAAKDWMPLALVAPYVNKRIAYTAGNRSRLFIFLRDKQSS